ncbi:dolichol-phosphate mannose synthase subunit 3-like isoform X2 [Primulina huaijiensis]|uniref:dolichol-phosphate mannose synthase subunit 3-like isoform X2 n=1 Tax=Primulina huaijiensis TaxID=1492673 RepID=UPI003CC73F66
MSCISSPTSPTKDMLDPMKHIVKILTLLVTLSALWVGLLQASIIPRSYTWLLPMYFIVSLGCYGLLMVGIGLMQFPTCPHEAILLQQDIIEAKEFLKENGVDVGFN